MIESKDIIRCSSCLGTGGSYKVFDYGEGTWQDWQSTQGKGFKKVKLDGNKPLTDDN